MKYFKLLPALLTITIMIVSCNDAKKEGNSNIIAKMAELEKLNSRKTKTDAEINKLQDELNVLKGVTPQSTSKLIAVSPVAVQKFEHYLDLRGRIDAENISFVSSRGMGGQVKSIFVKEGDVVKKGQLLLKIDDAVMRQSLTAARQQLEGIKTQLAFAKNIYERQNNLWEKGIGTEVQLISAKTNVTTLENQLKASEEQVKVGVEQMNTTDVRSDVDGIAETVMVKVGELFLGMGQIKIVNTNKLKVVASDPENYLTRIHKGLPVVINIPEAGKSINSTISLIGQTIENAQRGFMVEAKIPSDGMLKPNQSVVVKILDYSASNAVVIPVNTLQSDEHNKYVYIMEKSADGKMIATRKVLITGDVYGNLIEIKSGLTGGEQLVTSGYQNLYEGQVITTEVK